MNLIKFFGLIMLLPHSVTSVAWSRQNSCETHDDCKLYNASVSTPDDSFIKCFDQVCTAVCVDIKDRVKCEHATQYTANDKLKYSCKWAVPHRFWAKKQCMLGLPHHESPDDVQPDARDGCLNCASCPTKSCCCWVIKSTNSKQNKTPKINTRNSQPPRKRRRRLSAARGTQCGVKWKWRKKNQNGVKSQKLANMNFS